MNPAAVEDLVSRAEAESHRAALYLGKPRRPPQRCMYSAATRMYISTAGPVVSLQAWRHAHRRTDWLPAAKCCGCVRSHNCSRLVLDLRRARGRDLPRGHLFGQALAPVHVPPAEHDCDDEPDDAAHDGRREELGRSDDADVDDEGDGDDDADDEERQVDEVVDLEGAGLVLVDGVEPVDEEEQIEQGDEEVDPLEHVVSGRGREGLLGVPAPAQVGGAVRRALGLRGEHAPEDELHGGADNADDHEDDEDDGPDLHPSVEVTAAAALWRATAAEAEHEVEGGLLLD
eukprot:CAMPEP_0206005358 /NCGR_PEP_ID=MMETSP1464-20131121/4524_1 /ASSEMBLY_ACC=CAM_ASM_001124 /TAXON_ID=119497 /ORGANISM="Exanthemachrysis gayraliae, Strain RCC1523" /LENGTH=286 /DNA_ID=CAMNT_0053378791 /DNA_START=51 /DNA_END=908 /DNA_ORIENTATION=+